MAESIILSGIQTNNLKNITIRIIKNELNLLIGPSGSGKTSLAYDTVAQIGLHELGAMYHDEVNEPEYKISSYSNMTVTVPIEQINRNNNVRSTVGTYFSISPCLAKIYSSILRIPYDYFVLNKPENVCQSCLGVGYIKKLNKYKIVDYEKTIEEVPIRCWKKNKDFYRQILQSYCYEESIPTRVKFRNLTEEQKEKILFGIGKNKYNIRYKVTNHTSSRSTMYYGPMSGIPMLKNFSPSDEFYSEFHCEECLGEKFEIKHREHKICGYSIGELLLVPFNQLASWIKDVQNEYDCNDIAFSLSKLEAFANKAVELKLEYIYLNRTIPSLSGGELQRLRLIQVFNSQLSDLLIVLDEPLAGLSLREKKIVHDNILQLREKHTLLVIDHHDMFLKDASNIIALGEGGGHQGGAIIDANQYIEKQQTLFPYSSPNSGAFKRIVSSNCIYSYKGFDVTIADKGLNLVLGASGVGKSTLLREYFPQVFDEYLYINQKPIKGNIRSTVATSIGISDSIARIFANRFKKNKSLFSNMSGAEGMCKTCSGTGMITFGSITQSQITIKCKDCNGTGYSNKLTKFTINGKSIHDVSQMTISEGTDFFKLIDQRVFNMLRCAQKLMLGYLQIGEKAKDLSGGENVRVKLMLAMKTSKGIIGIDEPFKGLNNEEIYSISLVLSELVRNGKTIIVADHEEFARRFFPNQILLINNNGVLAGNL